LSVMKSDRPVGIIGYGGYVPRYRLEASEVNRIWHGGSDVPPIKEKAVPGPDEDTVTISIEAARSALRRARIDPALIRAVWVGSESHPYAVKPTSGIVAEAIGASPNTLGADLQFACKAGTEALQACVGLIGSGMADYAMAIGADCAQGRPGDALEYTAGAGGAAYVLGPASVSLAVLEASYSYVTDTPDFWRRPYQHYPRHGGRFTGQPAYFHHVRSAAQRMLEALHREPEDYAWVVLHQPNVRFPQKAAADLGFTRDQLAAGLLVNEIGNTYSAASLVGLAAALDVAEPGQRILHCSFGSGAGSDAFSWVVTDAIQERRDLAMQMREYVTTREAIDYATYARYSRELCLH